jgi:hypothetical protein
VLKNGPLAALDAGCGPSLFRRAGVDQGPRWSLLVAYQENGIDKLGEACPAAGRPQHIRERREGVKQNSAAHRVSIGSKTDKSADRRTCTVGKRSLMRERRKAKGEDMQVWLVGLRLKIGSRGDDNVVRVEESRYALRTLHRLAGDDMSNVASRFAWKKLKRVERCALWWPGKCPLALSHALGGVFGFQRSGSSVGRDEQSGPEAQGRKRTGGNSGNLRIWQTANGRMVDVASCQEWAQNRGELDEIGRCLTTAMRRPCSPKPGGRMRKGTLLSCRRRCPVAAALSSSANQSRRRGAAGPSHFFQKQLLPGLLRRAGSLSISSPAFPALHAERCQPRPATSVSQRRDHCTLTRNDWVQLVNACLACLLIYRCWLYKACKTEIYTITLRSCTSYQAIPAPKHARKLNVEPPRPVSSARKASHA